MLQLLQVVFSDAGFMVQGIHPATEQVNLSQQLHMLLYLLLQLQFLIVVQVEGGADPTWQYKDGSDGVGLWAWCILQGCVVTEVNCVLQSSPLLQSFILFSDCSSSLC